MARTIGILIFDQVEELDFVGPWEVLTAATEDMDDQRVVLIAPNSGPIKCDKGMRVLPDYTFANAPELDVIIVPGGTGARLGVDAPEMVAWLRAASEACTFVTSVCTGALLLVGSGVAAGARVTTHRAFIDYLRNMNMAEVIEDVRFVRDGRVITAAGVMSGIEMSLWLVREFYGAEVEAYVKDYIAYEYPPR